MSSYKLKRSTSLMDESKHLLNIDYFLIEEFTIKESDKHYGIKVETKSAGKITESCTVHDITDDKNEALYVLRKMADYGVTAIAAKDVIEDMAF